jgi:1-pyrroline-2-carboxylate reductase [NAD(P)H]
VRIITAAEVENALTFPRLIDVIRNAFAAPATIPPRSVFRLGGDTTEGSAFGVLPGWTPDVIGLKAFTYLPGNVAQDRKMIHALVLLFDARTGEPSAIVDGTTVTYWRTAAVSATAATFLARADAARLLLCATGNLAPYMARAHAAARPIRSIRVWGRNADHARNTVAAIVEHLPDCDVAISTDLATAARDADVISCATGSHEPLLRGAWLRPGTHVDLVGNHERHGRECDTELIVRARLFADSAVNVMNEAGEVLIPIDEGAITTSHLKGELADLCAARITGREDDDQVTCFKSVGMALGDLATAQYVAGTTL